VLRRAIWWLVIDVALLVGLMVAASAEMGRLAVAVEGWFGWPSPAGRWVVVVLSSVAAVPFLAGLIRLTRAIATRLAQRSLPAPAPGRLDRAFAPRTAFVSMLQYALLICCALPLFAVLVPLAPNAPVLLLAAALAVLGVVAVWRSANSLYGHARAGAEVIAMALLQHDHVRGPQQQLEEAMSRVTAMLPGLGNPEPVRLQEGDPGVGQTLASLDLRGATGANVVAILRPHGREMASVAPLADEPLKSGDVLAIAGAPDAVAAARAVLLARF
jgi:CPA2 family monovalent cation:H+ antiporter-2